MHWQNLESINCAVNRFVVLWYVERNSYLKTNHEKKTIENENFESFDSLFLNFGKKDPFLISGQGCR